MSTEAQQTANRAKVQNSSGPKTEAGKAASSRNRLRHGFAGLFGLLSNEDPDMHDATVLGLSVDFQRRNTTETILVECLAQYQLAHAARPPAAKPSVRTQPRS